MTDETAEAKKVELRKYRVNVDRGLEFDPLTNRIMDLRGEKGPPFVHIDCYRTIDADPASAAPLVKKGFLVPANAPTEKKLKVESIE